MRLPPLQRAHALALLVPLVLLLGAYTSQYIGGLFPCEMCWWQRYAAMTAVAFGLLACIARGRIKAMLILAAGLALLVNGLIGAYHAGVEYKWWPGLTHCSAMINTTGDFMKQIMAAPLVSCDQPQWTLFGISLAGFNALIAMPAALLSLLYWWRGSNA